MLKNWIFFNRFHFSDYDVFGPVFDLTSIFIVYCQHCQMAIKHKLSIHEFNVSLPCAIILVLFLMNVINTWYVGSFLYRWRLWICTEILVHCCVIYIIDISVTCSSSVHYCNPTCILHQYKFSRSAESLHICEYLFSLFPNLLVFCTWTILIRANLLLRFTPFHKNSLKTRLTGIPQLRPLRNCGHLFKESQEKL